MYPFSLCSSTTFTRGKDLTLSIALQLLGEIPLSKASQKPIRVFPTSLLLAWSSSHRPHMQHVLRSRTSKSSSEPRQQEKVAEAFKGAGTWGHGCCGRKESETVGIQLLPVLASILAMCSSSELSKTDAHVYTKWFFSTDCSEWWI